MKEKMDLPDRLLTCADASALLGVSEATIRTWTCRGRIPFVKLNGRRTVRYRLSELERIIKAGEHPANRDRGGDERHQTD